MKKLIGWLACLAFVFNTNAQSFEEEVLAFQTELNEHYKNKEKSPLGKKARRKFKGHNFYPLNAKFRVEARFVRADTSVSFGMKTSTTRLPMYEIYGQVHFEIDGINYSLTVYQSHSLREIEEYKSSLFLPFTDVTNSEETYGGGRYIDLIIPEGDIIIIDFNQAYNPYCAYSYQFSCPIPPRENDLDVRILAGVRYLDSEKH